MIIVSNTTPLIGLAIVGQFDLLAHLFGKIIIPTAVYEEAVRFGREQGGAKQEVSQPDQI
jgi:predicted nucleic acid-binding protein